MIIKFGVAVVGARGTAGGLTFSANKGGPYAKLWSKGSNPSSSSQSAQRGVLTKFASGWRNLTQVQRDDWDDYADDPAQELTNSLGQTYFISGFNWYVAINSNLAAAGAAARDDAPTLTRPLAPIIEQIFWDVTPPPGIGNIRYTVGDPDLAANHVVWGLVVNSQGIGTIPQKLPFLVIAVPNPSRQLELGTALIDHFGSMSLNQRLLIRSAIQDAHGQRGPDDTIIADPV